MVEVDLRLYNYIIKILKVPVNYIFNFELVNVKTDLSSTRQP
jgi:hypothetical protein